MKYERSLWSGIAIMLVSAYFLTSGAGWLILFFTGFTLLMYALYRMTHD